MARSLDKEWKKLVLQEEKSYREIEKKCLNEKTTRMNALKQGVMEKIPEKMIVVLCDGFYKAFELIFLKGTYVIGKTYNEEELNFQFFINNMSVERKPNAKSLRQMEKGIKKGQRMNTCTTMFEGIGLGAFGVGMPDIFLFLGIVLKGIYETAIGYGYDYKDEREQILILKMIYASLVADDMKREANYDVENWILHIDTLDYEGRLDEEMKKASSALSEAMLLSKFIQGFFIVGVIGGVINPFIYQKIIKYVNLKYKKRYINEKRKRIKNTR
ncbi:MAG: EcsC family protein [Anaerotignum sp.]